MADILETLVEVKTMDETDVKAKFGTSSSNVKKVLKALLMEEMASEIDRPKRHRQPKAAAQKGVSTQSKEASDTSTPKG
jgi:transcription initiation factor IIE alpha subunit